MGITNISVYADGVNAIVLTSAIGTLNIIGNPVITIPVTAANIQNGGPGNNGPFLITYNSNGYILTIKLNNYQLVGGVHQFS